MTLPSLTAAARRLPFRELHPPPVPRGLAACGALALGGLFATLPAQSAVGVQAVAPSARYVVVDLGIGSTALPTGMSGAGHVTGIRFGAGGERRAFLWHRGVVTDLGTFGGTSQAFAVNTAGVAVGYSVDTQGRQRAFRWRDGVMVDLGTLQGGGFASAHDINESGWIAGTSETRHGNDRWQRATLWRDGTALDLGTFGGEYSEARAINEAGQVVGWAWYPLPRRTQRAFLWSAATGMTDLGTLGGASSIASDVNDAGVVVGSAYTASGDTHAFLWTPQTGMLDLGKPAGAERSHAFALNNAGQVVGYAFFSLEIPVEPLLWEDGAMRRLNDLVDPSSGWTLTQANDIDDAGNIVGTARRNGSSYHPVLLVPAVRR